jgi:hypothetical protein
MASSYGLPQPHPSNFVLPIPPDVVHDADFDDVLLLKLLSDLRTLVVAPGSSLVLPAQLIILLFSYRDQLADKPGTSIVAFFEFISILDDLHDAFDFSAIPISSSSFSVDSSNELHANSRLSDDIDSAISLLSSSDLTVMVDCPDVVTTLDDDHLAPSDFRPPSIPPVNLVTDPSPNFSAPREICGFCCSFFATDCLRSPCPALWFFMCTCPLLFLLQFDRSDKQLGEL